MVWGKVSLLKAHELNILGESSLKVVIINLVSNTNLPWNKTIGSLFYMKRKILKNSLKIVLRITLKNGEEFALI